MKLASSGYKVEDICRAFEVSRSSYYYHRGKAFESRKFKKRDDIDREVFREIEEVKREHPFYGYRRVTALIRRKIGKSINRKRIHRLMKEGELLCKKRDYKAKRRKSDDKSKPEAKHPNDWWGTDMTKHYVDGYGWLYIIVVLDWYTKEVLGLSVAEDCKTERWEEALEDAVLYACPEGSREYDINLISDNGSQPTSKKYEKTCKRLGINHVTTSYNNPKGNAETESWIKTLKEDCLWIRDFESFEDAKQKIYAWLDYYNTEYPHSSIGYRTPREMREEARFTIETLNQKAVKCV